ncbi:fimbria/pilus outer membrane usher protein [Novosphingobium sp. BL-8A]|uniref:fimbria/pilus outer membrane usher protein n=1 Tax=Novosphingobium sp. BL-8A TaxID=3127639 RepID=UPI0037576A21
MAAAAPSRKRPIRIHAGAATGIAALLLASESPAAPGPAPEGGGAAPAADFFSDLPPPVERADFAADQTLQLEIFVNGMTSGVVASVLKRGNRFQLRTADLRRAGMVLPTADETIFLDTLDGVVADYDPARQQLHLTVLPDYLPNQQIGPRRTGYEPARRDTGALLNYDAYLTGGGGLRLQASLWHEARVFGPAGVFSTTGVIRTSPGHRSEGRHDAPYIRYDTNWRWSDERTMTTVEAGDIITRTLPWAPAVRLGGAQISRDFSVRPDVVTYPLPEFAGSAAVPSTVDLVVNGLRIAGSQVNPGPFSLGTLPPINGYGQANLIVTDMLGRSIATSVPFYVSSALLRPGLTDYSVAAGSFRRNYGIRNFDYDGFAVSAYARHGLNRAITLELRGEAAESMRLFGAGAVVRVGEWGIVNASYSRNVGQASGGELTVGYEYQARTFSVGVRHTRHDSDYVDLALLDQQYRRGWERQTVATASLALGRGGTLGLGYFDLRQQDARASKLANIAWTVPLWRESRLYAGLSRDFAGRGWAGALTLTVPLGTGNASGGVARDLDGRAGLTADYSRPIPTDGGWGWSASAYGEPGHDPYLRGDVAWRTQPIQLRAGAYGQGDYTGWFGASGSLVFMDGALFTANRVTDAFALVTTNGEAGVPVRYENQLIGETDRDGRLLIPAASAWYPAHYDIDTLSLPPSIQADIVSRRVAVAAGSGYVVRFPLNRVTAARAILVDAAGKPIPPGSAVILNDKGQTYVGWDGMLYLENVTAENTLVATLADGGTCRARFAAQLPAEDILDLGTVTCR